MTDLHDYLAEIAGPETEPTGDTVTADVARGRKALHRRRIVQSAGGTAFVAAGLAAVLTLSLSGGGAAAPPVASARSAVSLVAYTGAQPKGFTIDKVPDGWFIQADTTGVLTIAPDKARTVPSGVNPSSAPVYDERSYADKIAVFLQSRNEPTPPPPYIKIGNQQGLFVRNERGNTTLPTGEIVREPERADGDYGASIWVEQPNGKNAVIQFWAGLGFTDQQMIELAGGVHVHKDAVQADG